MGIRRLLAPSKIKYRREKMDSAVHFRLVKNYEVTKIEPFNPAQTENGVEPFQQPRLDRCFVVAAQFLRGKKNEKICSGLPQIPHLESQLLSKRSVAGLIGGKKSTHHRGSLQKPRRNPEPVYTREVLDSA